MSELIERLKNKINYYIYKTVNDDDANKFAEEEFNEFINLKYHELKNIQKTLYDNLAKVDSNY